MRGGGSRGGRARQPVVSRTGQARDVRLPPVKLVLLVVLVVFVVLFVVGVLAPRFSRRMQGGFSGLIRRGERKSDENAGKLGDATNSTLGGVRRAADSSAEAGRNVHDKLEG